MTTPTTKRTTGPAFQFYPDAFLSSTKVMAMSLTERGIYITLLCACWLDGGLPTDTDALARMVGMKANQFAKLWPHNLARCFVEKKGRLVNPRMERERQKQIDYRTKQRTAAEQRWEKLATSKPDSKVEAASCSLVSVSVSSSVSDSKTNTHTGRGAPIHQPHHKHAACGRVCVPADLHSEFVTSRNHDRADKELRDWYLIVDNAWSVGEFKDANTGASNYSFWRARFDEKWPAVKLQAKASNQPEWMQRAKAAAKAAQS